MFSEIFLGSCLFLALLICFWVYFVQQSYRKIQRILRQSIGKKIFFHERIPLEWGCYNTKEGILLAGFDNEDYVLFDENLKLYEVHASIIMKITKVSEVTDEKLCTLLTSDSPIRREFAYRIKLGAPIEPQWMKYCTLLDLAKEGFTVKFEKTAKMCYARN